MTYEEKRAAYLKHVCECAECQHKLFISNDDDWAYKEPGYFPGRKIQYYTVWNLCHIARSLLNDLIP